MKPFSRPKERLGGLDGDLAGRLAFAAADLALILDAERRVLDVAVGADDLPAALCEGWVGKPFADTLTVESRAKLTAVLDDARGAEPGRWRHLNHPTGEGADLPMLYRAVTLGRGGNLLLIGRDLRPMALLQQRLLAAQQSLERDYSRLRHVETRYRLLFQIASDPILVVDAATRRILEANPAANRRFGGAARELVDRPFPSGFVPEDATAIEAMLAGVRTTGRPDEVLARAGDGTERYTVAASLFRQEATSLFLVRLAPLAQAGPAPSSVEGHLLRALAEAPDAFALTAADGRIVHVNMAFVELAQLATADQAIGETLDRWVGRSGVDLNVLFANLRERGAVKLFSTEFRGEFGVTTDAEISAVSVVNGGKPHFAFLIRNVGRRLQTTASAGRTLPRSAEQLTELVGRVSLKDLVRETTDMIERLYIEAALDLTGNNRASAAELLGLSRQSLYVKLHRYGLRDADADDLRNGGEAGGA